jgi:hypothetical protein
MSSRRNWLQRHRGAGIAEIILGRVTDADVRSAADAMVASGMRDAGYVYINIDDTWEENGTRAAVSGLRRSKRTTKSQA